MVCARRSAPVDSPADRATRPLAPLIFRKDGRVEEEAHRGRTAPGGDQQAVEPGEVHPQGAPVHPAPVVGAPPPGHGARGPLLPTGRRPLGTLRGLPGGGPHRWRERPGSGGPGESGGRAAAPLHPHHADGELEQYRRRASSPRGPRGDPALDGRRPARRPRPLRRGRIDPAGGPEARARGARLGPQPRRRPHQQGPHRDPAALRRSPARIPRRRRRHADLARRPRPGRGRAPLRRVDARGGAAPHRASLPEGAAARRRRGDGHRLDLGAHRHLPEPRLRDRDAARALVVAGEEEGQGGLHRPDGRRRSH